MTVAVEPNARATSIRPSGFSALKMLIASMRRLSALGSRCVSDAGPPSLRHHTRVAGELRTHYESGRLTLEEFQERLDEAHAARTESQLEHVLRQLPPVAASLPALVPTQA